MAKGLSQRKKVPLQKLMWNLHKKVFKKAPAEDTVEAPFDAPTGSLKKHQV
jgi:hypothetical protein